MCSNHQCANKAEFTAGRVFTDCVGVCVCVCVCVYTLPPGGFFRLHDVCVYVRGSDQRSFPVSITWVLSAKFLHLNFRFYHISPPKTKTPARNLLEGKNDVILTFRKDDIY